MNINIKHKAVLISFLFTSFQALAEVNTREIERKLTIVRARISNTEKEVQTSSQELTNRAKTVKEIELEVAKLDKGQKEGEEKLKKINKELESISLQLDDGRAQLQIKRSNFVTRLRGMYKARHGLPALSFIFESRDVHSLYRRASYMQKLIVEDRSQLSDYEGLLKTLAETERARQSYFKEEQEVVDRVKSLKSEQERKRMEEAKAAKELKDQVDSRKVLIVALQKQEEEFENILQGLMGGNVSSTTTVPESEDKPAITEEKSVISKRSVFFPVPGTIVQHFGKQKHSDYKEVIDVKGIEMSASSGSLVRAIAEGSVVFSSTLPGFGNVVIIEHPSKYYSLYGRIMEPVPIGKVLEKGDSVGVTSDKDEKGRNFYFELRKNGVPLNPEDYLRRG